MQDTTRNRYQQQARSSNKKVEIILTEQMEARILGLEKGTIISVGKLAMQGCI